MRGDCVSKTFSANYTFGETGQCSCGKISGPDTVIAL